MPSGRVHNIINTATYGVIAAAAVWGSQQQLIVITPVQGLAFSAAYAAGTFLLSPDLDLAEGRVDSKRRWGWLGFVWVPYGRMFSHRGLSHTWLLGPLTRLVYLGLMLTIVWALLSAVWPALKWPPLGPSEFNLTWLLPLALGYYVSQWLHLIADGVRPDHGMRRGQQKFRQLRGKARRLSPQKSGRWK
ncbi:metal-binding protein [Deinococcus rubellus]|uniref:Metal-binding protein n=1 Tax=Deinococcus rubellus TaxID=1889240 RepID=A0ABY5YI44_9DEIO|nr:metal-binding protein [Deinococcus rubellus]UWX64601.1 metal-binding protein [Deinococcus rubellus]